MDDKADLSKPLSCDSELGAWDRFLRGDFISGGAGACSFVRATRIAATSHAISSRRCQCGAQKKTVPMSTGTVFLYRIRKLRLGVKIYAASNFAHRDASLRIA